MTSDELVIVRVHDVINAVLSAHEGCTCESPPQPVAGLSDVLLLAPGTNDACFVGKDDCLDAVAQVQFVEDAGDVRLDG